MQELERMIKIYHTAFTICLILGIILLAISIFLFFKFDIRQIIDMKTGRGAKKTIQKMAEINARTGKLRQDMVSHTPLSLKPEDRITYPVTSAMPTIEPETAPLGTTETEVLYQEPETTVLSENSTEMKERKKQKISGRFKIEKEIIWIHTKEML